MRHPGSLRVEDLPIRRAPWLLIAGGVALVVGVVLVIGAALPDPGILTAEVSASAHRLADMSALDRGGRHKASDPGSPMGLSADIAALSDYDGGIRTELPGTGARGAFHAGDRSPYAVSSRIDVQLDLMEMADWRRRQEPAAVGPCPC